MKGVAPGVEEYTVKSRQTRYVIYYIKFIKFKIEVYLTHVD